MLPPEVAAALPASIDPATVSSYARLHAAIDSPLGESHLVAGGGLILAVTRRSPFDPFVVVELAPGGASYEEGAFSRKLTLVSVAGATHVMDVSILDVDAIKAFMTGIGRGESAVPTKVSPAKAPSELAPRREAVTVPARTEDRSLVRAKLLGVMKSRVTRARDEPFPGHERYIAPTHALPGIKAPTPTSSRERPAAEPTRAKKKKKRADHTERALSPRPRAPSELAAQTDVPDGPLFRTGHWIALLVIAPLIFLAFVMIARAMR